MFRTTLMTFSLGLALLAPPSLTRVAADEGKAPSELYHAYFLEQQSHNYSAAKAIYDKLLGDRLDADARRLAQAGADRCRDHLIAEDFASVMPADAVVFAEFKRPGEILRQFAGMLGFNDKTIAEALAARPNTASNAPFHVPSEIVISPAIFDALGAFGGGAIALTDIDVEGNKPPSGVLVIHHGDVKMLKGILETAFQFAPTAEKIGDMPTFATTVPDVGELTGVLTDSLAVVGTSRALVEGVVTRIKGDTSSSLGKSKELRDAMEGRHGTFFAYGDIQKLIASAKKAMSPDDRDDFAKVNAFADLESLRWATLSMGADEGVMGAEIKVKMAKDHHNFVYNFLRLCPMTKNCLSKVPADAAAVFGMGLNPPMPVASAAKTSDGETSPPAITGFDIGREFFGNIQEFCVYIVPGAIATAGEGEHGHPIPNAGVLLAVNDVQKSRALWNELLKLPGLLGGDKPIEPKAVQIGGVNATAYAIPEVGKVYLAELDGCVAFGMTRTAIKAAIRAQADKKSILDDPALGAVVTGMSKDTSIMFAGHLGRLARVATAMHDDEVGQIAAPMTQLCKDTVCWFTVSQAPDRFSARFALKGLPRVNDALKQFGPAINAAAATFAPRPGFAEPSHKKDAASDEAASAKAPAKKRHKESL